MIYNFFSIMSLSLAPGNTVILSQPYRRRVSTDRLNREGSQLVASLEGEPGPTPAGKTLPHSFPETRFRREGARDDIQKKIYYESKPINRLFSSFICAISLLLEYFCANTVVVVVVVSHIQRIGCQPEKTTLHGGQSRSWSAEQGMLCKSRSTPVAQLAPRNLLTRWDVSSIPANGIFLTKN